MIKNFPRHLRKLAKLAISQGWEIDRTGSGHLKWKNPDGRLVITRWSPKSWAGERNDISLLKRGGLSK